MLTKGSTRNKGSRATEPTLKPHLSLIAHEVTTSQSSGLARRSTSGSLICAVVYQGMMGSDPPLKALGLVKRSTPESPFCTFLSGSTERAPISPPLPSHPFISKTAYMTPFWSYLQNSTQGAKISQACDTSYFPKVRENKRFLLSPSRVGAGMGAQAQAVGMKHPSQARTSDPLPVCHLCHADRDSSRPRLSHLTDYQQPSSAIIKSSYARTRRVLRVTSQARASDPLPVCYLHHPEGLPRAFIPFTLALDPSVQKCRDDQ